MSPVTGQEILFRVAWKCGRLRGKERVSAHSAKWACVAAKRAAARHRDLCAKDIQIIYVEMPT